jgi:uncharacterized repeat protein (TIGR01451 family)
MKLQACGIVDRGLAGIAAWILAAVAAILLVHGVEVVAGDGQQNGAVLLKGEEIGPEIRLLESDESHVLFELEVPGYSLNRRTVGGELYDVVSIPGWGLTQEEGAPQLPTRGIMVGIPPNANVELRVVEATGHDAGPFRILPTPERVLQDGPADWLDVWTSPPQVEQRFVASPGVYAIDAFSPSEAAALDGVGYLRNQRFATIQLCPIRYNPVAGKLRVHTRLQIELLFSYPVGAQRSQSRKPVPESPVYEQILEDQLLNYDSAREWRMGPAKQAIDATWPLTTTAYKISVVQDGIYQLTYHDLAQAGLQMDTVDPQTIQLFSRGEELAILVVGEEDGEFNSTDYVLFCGQGVENKYTDRNVYWLIHGHEPGRRMPARGGVASGSAVSSTVFSAQVDAEEDVRYMSLWPGDDSTDRWFWQPLVVLSVEDPPPSHTVDIDLGQVSAEGPFASLRVYMKGQSATSHLARFYVNGSHVGEHAWDGTDTVEMAEVGFNQSILKSGVNTVTTELGVAKYESVYLDRYELEYGHAYWANSNQLEFSQETAGGWAYEIGGFTRSDVSVFDVSDPLTVTQMLNLEVESTPAYTVRFSDTVTGTRTYLALTPDRWLSPESVSLDTVSDLKNTANGADYIVISHSDFLTAAERLASYRADQSLRTVVVDIQDVYDEFGYGLLVPAAVREFVRYAYEHWQPPAPTYVVLLGDGTYDPKNNLDLGVVNYITPYLADVDEWMGETATDNWYVDVVTDPMHLQDLMLGRMPANTLTEADIMVDKTIAYEQSEPGADWTGHVIYVAGRQPDPKGAGYFHNLSEALIEDYVSPLYDVSRVYLGNHPILAPKSTCASGDECRQQLIEAINDGAWLVNYIGHGSVIQWDGAYILNLEAIEQLTNGDRLPVMLPMTCLEGQFHGPYPNLPSISESIVRAEGGGAVASWGPTGLGVAYGHDDLNRGFLEAVLHDGVREFGPATYAGKLRLALAGHSLEQIDEYTVFGDPALRLHSPPTDLRIEKQAEYSEEVRPGDMVTFTLAFSNAGPGIAFEPVLTDLMPSLLVNPSVIYSSAEVLSQREGITFSWTITDLWPHTGGQVVIRAQVAADAEVPVAFFNEARINSTTPDLAPVNNHATAGVGTQSVYLPLILRNRSAVGVDKSGEP